MENKIYIAQYVGAKYENGEREYMAIPYRSIGKALQEAIIAVQEQNKDIIGFVDIETSPRGEHGLTIKPVYDRQHIKSNDIDGQWECITIELMDIK